MAVLGRRHWYRYDSDDGKNYRIRLLDYLAEAAGLELDDTLPELPRGYEPRFIWVQEVEPSTPGRPLRKKLIVEKKNLQHFLSNPTIEVAGIKMKMTSSVGEIRRGRGRNDGPISEVRVDISTEP